MFVAREFLSKDKTIQGHVNKKSESELMSFDQSGKLLGLYDKLIECEIIDRANGGFVGEESKGGAHEVHSTHNTDGSLLFDLAATSIDLQD